MIITKQMQEIISEQFGEKPLTADEIRRIPKLGNLYVSASIEHADEENFRYLFSLTLNGKKYCFFTAQK